MIDTPKDGMLASPRVHSSEIASRGFPRARKGLDPAAVRAWLKIVAASHALVEEELAFVRHERDQIVASLRRSRVRPASADVRAALMQTQLRRRAGGYDRKEVEELLRAAAAEMARLENQIAVLEAEMMPLPSTASATAPDEILLP